MAVLVVVVMMVVTLVLIIVVMFEVVVVLFLFARALSLFLSFHQAYKGHWFTTQHGGKPHLHTQGFTTRCI